MRVIQTKFRKIEAKNYIYAIVSFFYYKVFWFELKTDHEITAMET